MAACMEEVLSGEASPAQVAGLLVALRMKGEVVAELAGAARVLRAHAVPIPDVPADAIDTCGTGGDGAGTLNVSTAAGLVAAAAGVPVAELAGGAVRLRTVTAAEAGLGPAPIAALRVGSVAEAAERLRAILGGERGPGRDVVCLNAAAALVVAGRAADLREGAAFAAAAIDRGRASALLERLVAFTTARADRV